MEKILNDRQKDRKIDREKDSTSEMKWNKMEETHKDKNNSNSVFVVDSNENKYQEKRKHYSQWICSKANDQIWNS